MINVKLGELAINMAREPDDSGYRVAMEVVTHGKISDLF